MDKKYSYRFLTITDPYNSNIIRIKRMDNYVCVLYNCLIIYFVYSLSLLLVLYHV